MPPDAIITLNESMAKRFGHSTYNKMINIYMLLLLKVHFYSVFFTTRVFFAGIGF